MANASVELSWVAPAGAIAVELHGPCFRQQLLSITGSTQTISSAVSAAELVASGGQCIARIATDDTGCFVATGTVPDPTATTATAASTARRYVPAGGEITLKIGVGEFVAVHS